MAEVLEKVKISELPSVTDLDGLVTIGTDGQSRSVKVPIIGLTKPPIIGSDGFWYIFNISSGAYAKTNYVAVGKSAYQQAVEAGYTGTEAQFMNALAKIGDPSTLTTANKSSLVAAINELNAKVGDLSALETTAKTTLIAAINELVQSLSDLGTDVSAKMGSLDDLETADKSSLVAAINEAAMTGGGGAVGGYVIVSSLGELPDPGEPNIGYLVGENLYLYVGTGGDTLGGKYKNCGPFRGPRGAAGVGFSSVSSNQDGTLIIALTNGDTITVDLNHDHPQYAKCVYCASQAAYDAITPKDSDTLYVILETE